MLAQHSYLSLKRNRIQHPIATEFVSVIQATQYKCIQRCSGNFLARVYFCSLRWRSINRREKSKQQHTSAIFGFQPPWPSCISRKMSMSSRHFTLSPCWNGCLSVLSFLCSSAGFPEEKNDTSHIQAGCPCTVGILPLQGQTTLLTL